MSIWVEIIDVKGSSPRDAGTVMEVHTNGITGTIGGGALEHQAIQIAQQMICDGSVERTEKFALGPSLGQCCGGAVTLQFDRRKRVLSRTPDVSVQPSTHIGPQTQLWIWGAGHVGRAVVAAANLSVTEITWIDTDHSRFPADVSPDVVVVPAADMPQLAARAPHGAHHLIFTYSHAIDFDLCAALVQRPTASIGLIGSDTKKARFFRRLSAMGLDPHRITCPIGDKSLGKAPHQIAFGTLTALYERTGLDRAS